MPNSPPTTGDRSNSRRSTMARILIALLIGVGTSWSSLTYAEPTQSRQAELLHRLKHDCGSCHGMTMKGGLGPPLLPVSVASKTDDVLTEVILSGVPGTPMPPWNFELSHGEALWLVRQLKEGLDE